MANHSEYNGPDYDVENDPDLVQDILGRHKEMLNIRTPYALVWDDVTEYVLPSRGTYVYRDMRFDPERRSRRRFDSTPVLACRHLTSKILAEMTGTGSRWFDYRVRDPNLDADPDVRKFLQDLSDKAYGILNSGSFRLAHVEATTDWVAYGTGVMMREEIDGDMVFRAVPPSEIFVEENKAGEIDCVMRLYKLPMRNVIQAFGIDNLPEELVSPGSDDEIDLHDEVQILHAVIPNGEYKDGSKNKKYQKFKSCFILYDHQVLLKEDGYKRMPYRVFRFWKRSGESYGGSPAIDSLADIRMLNLLVESYLRGVQLECWPPLTMAHDSVIMPLKVVPNGTNYGGISPDGKRLVDRLLPPVNSRNDINDTLSVVRNSINQSFFVDPLMNREQSIRTAAEVAKRSNEEMIGIAPFLNRYEVEYLSPILDDILDFLLRKDKSVKVPAALHGKEPYIEYTAPLAKTQRATELNNILQFLQVIQSLGQVDPSMMAHINFNKTFNELTDLFSIPLDTIYSQKEMQAKAMAMAKAQQQAAQQQQMAQGVDSLTNTVTNLAKSGLLQRQDLGLPSGEPGMPTSPPGYQAPGAQ